MLPIEVLSIQRSEKIGNTKYILAASNLSLEKKSFPFQQHLFFMCWLWDLTWWPPFSCRPRAFFIDPCYCCRAHPPFVFAPSHSLPVPADSNCTGVRPGCLYCTWRYSRDQNSAGSGAGWFKSHVCAVAPSAAGGIRQAMQPTAWFQSPRACGARLSEREQMVTWIVQQVLSTPAHCLACCTLPQQTLLIIDVLEWAPSSLDSAEWQNHQGHYRYRDTLTVLKGRVQDFFKRSGLLETSWKLLRTDYICQFRRLKHLHVEDGARRVYC